MKKITGLLAAIGFTLGSCTDVVQVKVDKGDTLLVVDAFIDNSSDPQNVRLTFTADYFSNTHTPPVIGATVSLQDLTNGRTYAFMPDGNGNYIYTPQVNDSMAQVGHNYQLNITYNNASYSSISKLNRTTRIDTILWKRSKGRVADTTQLPRKYFPYLIARDAPGATDYYWIKSYKNGIFYNGPNQLNVVQDAAGPGSDGLFFIPPVAFFALTPDNDPFYDLDRCTVKIYSINANTYDFFDQMRSQMTNAQSGLFAVTPQNVRTNIASSSGNAMKAIGWFNMGAVSSKTVVAP